MYFNLSRKYFHSTFFRVKSVQYKLTTPPPPKKRYLYIIYKKITFKATTFQKKTTPYIIPHIFFKHMFRIWIFRNGTATPPPKVGLAKYRVTQKPENTRKSKFPPGIRTWPVAFGINSSTSQFSRCFVFVVRYITPFTKTLHFFFHCNRTLFQLPKHCLTVAGFRRVPPVLLDPVLVSSASYAG